MVPILSSISDASAKGYGLFSSKTDIVINPVTSGLLFTLDASNPSSYSGTGTTVLDISGNGRHGVFNNSNVSWVAKSGSTPAYFKFNGSTDSDYLYQNQGSSSSVVDVVIGIMVTDANSTLGCVYSYTGSSDKSLRLWEASSTTWGFRGGSGSIAPTDGNDWQNGQESYTTINNNTSIVANNTYPTNTWGVLRSYSSNSAFTRPHNYMLGAGAYPGRQLRGRINFIHGYNRQLTTQEVTSIYSAYRGRLGL
jgi:hypothetical protein